MITQEEKNLIKVALEYYVDYKKDLEKREMLDIIEKDLLLIVDSPCKRLQKLSKDVSNISKVLDIKVKWDR